MVDFSSEPTGRSVSREELNESIDDLCSIPTATDGESALSHPSVVRGMQQLGEQAYLRFQERFPRTYRVIDTISRYFQ